jgi:hypothetical protein
LEAPNQMTRMPSGNDPAHDFEAAMKDAEEAKLRAEALEQLKRKEAR